MGNARHVGRIGSLAVALGIGVGLGRDAMDRICRAGERSEQRTKYEHLEGR
jgi:hypothetical protein